MTCPNKIINWREPNLNPINFEKLFQIKKVKVKMSVDLLNLIRRVFIDLSIIGEAPPSHQGQSRQAHCLEFSD